MRRAPTTTPNDELGYTVYYTPLGNASGRVGYSAQNTAYDNSLPAPLNLGAYLGVIGDPTTGMIGTGSAGIAPNGNRYYVIAEANAEVTLSLEPLAIASLDSVQVSMWMQSEQGKTWDAGDTVRLWLTTDTGVDVTMLLVTQSNHNSELPGGQWKNVVRSASVGEDVASVQVKVTATSQAGTGLLWLDHFQVRAQARLLTYQHPRAERDRQTHRDALRSC
eukprot:COSAG05_NODE_465_length_9537_cov_21.527086_14_plen_220_part_00